MPINLRSLFGCLLGPFQRNPEARPERPRPVIDVIFAESTNPPQAAANNPAIPPAVHHNRPLGIGMAPPYINREDIPPLFHNRVHRNIGHGRPPNPASRRGNPFEQHPYEALNQAPKAQMEEQNNFPLGLARVYSQGAAAAEAYAAAPYDLAGGAQRQVLNPIYEDPEKSLAAAQPGAIGDASYEQVEEKEETADPNLYDNTGPLAAAPDDVDYATIPDFKEPVYTLGKSATNPSYDFGHSKHEAKEETYYGESQPIPE